MDSNDHVYFWANPYFDEIMVFTVRVPTTQDKFKPFKCDSCHELNLYQAYSKVNKSDFVSKIKGALLEKRSNEWPYKGDLLLQFSVTDTKNRLRNVDLDNLAKTILDSFKNTVFDDDGQILAIAGDKSTIPYQEEDLKKIKEKKQSPIYAGFMVAIRRLEESELQIFQSDFYASVYPKDWGPRFRNVSSQARILGSTSTS